MNEMIMAWVRPAALIIILAVVCYMEILQLKVSEFFIGIATMIVVWFFKDRDQKQAGEQAVAQIKAMKEDSKG